MNICLTVAMALHMWIGMPGTAHIISVNAPGVYLQGVEMTPADPVFVRDAAYLEYRGEHQDTTTLTLCPGYLAFLPVVR